jgi:hypothetical protein
MRATISRIVRILMKAPAAAGAGKALVPAQQD